MKAIILSAIYLFILSCAAICQCTKPGLKIQSQACDSPQNLIANAITCSSVKVNWLGNKEQSYIIKAFCTEPATGKQAEAKTSKIFCDDNGNCAATVFVTEGSILSWSVQSICTMENAIMYSSEINGKNTFAPLCPKVLPKTTTRSTSQIIAYPSPVTRGEKLQLRLQNTKANKIEMINTDGQVIYNSNTQITGSIDIPISASWAAGQYLLRVVSVNKIYTQKIFIN